MRNEYKYYTDYEDTSFEEETPAALATPSDDQILAFVQANIGNPALIAETAAQYGVSVADLSRVTGYGEDAVTSYFDQHDVAPPAYTPPPVEISRPEPPPDEPIYEPPPPLEEPIYEPPRPPKEPVYEPPPPPPERPVYEPPRPPKEIIEPPEDLYSSWAQDQSGNPYTKQVVGPRTTFRQDADGTLTELDERGDPIKAAVTSGLSAVSTVPTTTADTTPVGALTTVQNNTATNQAASTTPVGGLTQAAPANALDNVTQQILGQNLTSKWKGEGKGSAQANAADMAQMMVSAGITDISQFGKVALYEPVQEISKTYNGQNVSFGYDAKTGTYTYGTNTGAVQTDGEGNVYNAFVPIPQNAKLETTYGIVRDGGESGGYLEPVDTSKLKTVDGKLVGDTGQTTFGNKLTGQAIANNYETGSNAFGGTYDGSGNTGYRVQFTADGKPIFYTTYATSNDLAKIMDDIGPLGQIALAFVTGGLSIPEQIAAKFAMSVLSGQDIGDAIKSAATSYVGSLVPGLDIIKDGASYLTDLDSTGILSKAFTGAAVGGTKAILSNQDLGDAVLAGAASGGASGATTALLGNIEGFDDLSKTQQTTIRNVITGTLTGKPITTTLLNSVIDTATSEVGKAIDSTVTGLTDDNTLDSSTIDKVTSTLNVDGTDGTGDDDDDDDDDGDGDGDDVVTTTTTGGTGKSSLGNNATVGAVTSVLKSTLANTAKTATKGAIKSTVTGKKMAARPSVAKQLTGDALSSARRAVPTKVDISKLIPTTTTKKAPPKKVDVAQLKAMTPVSGLSAIKKG